MESPNLDAAGGMRQERVLGGWLLGLAWGWWLRGRGPGGNLGPWTSHRPLLVLEAGGGGVRGIRNLGLGEGDLPLASKCGVRSKCFSPARLLSERDGVAGARTARAWEPGDLF